MRQQHLATVRGAHDARGTVDHAAVEVVVTVLVDDTRMQPTAYPKGNVVRLSGIDERLLQLQRGADRVEGILEGGMDAVASRLHERATVALYGRSGDCVVAYQCWPHPFRHLLPQPSTALDVREQESNDARSVEGAHCDRGGGSRRALWLSSRRSDRWSNRRLTALG